MEKNICSYVYMLSNTRNTVLYIGVTTNLLRRIYEHKQKLVKGFSSHYNLTKLVYYEIFQDIYSAILREKQLKAGSRKQKNKLISEFNPNWNDLYEHILA